MNKRILVAISLCLAIMTGCKTGKKSMENGKNARGERLLEREKERTAFREAVADADLDFGFFAARGKASVSSGGKQYDLNINLRIEKDKVIWASVTAFLGLEVARAMITPDSVLLVNRLERTYLREDFSHLKELLHPGVSFGLLEAVLSGNAPAYLLGNRGQLWLAGSTYRLEGSEEAFAYTITFDEKHKTRKIFIREQQGEGVFNVDYDNFENRHSKWFPKLIAFSSEGVKKALNVRLAYDTVTLDETQSFPFEIPARYKPMR